MFEKLLGRKAHLIAFTLGAVFAWAGVGSVIDAVENPKMYDVNSVLPALAFIVFGSMIVGVAIHNLAQPVVSSGQKRGKRKK